MNDLIQSIITGTALTLPRQHGPVLRGEAAAGDAAVRVEGDPHCAAVGVDRWWRYTTAEPAAWQKKKDLLSN